MANVIATLGVLLTLGSLAFHLYFGTYPMIPTVAPVAVLFYLAFRVAKKN